MQQNVDVAAADPERGGDVLAGFFLEHAERHDGALRVAELLDARAQADVLFGARDVLLGEHGVIFSNGLVRPRDVVRAAFVASRVPHDRREPRTRVARDLALRDELEIRAECILYAIHRVLRGEPFTPRHVVLPSLVSSRVAHDRREPGPGVARRFSAGDEAQIRAECILYAVDRVLRVEPLAARYADEARPFGEGSLRKNGKWIHVRKIPHARYPFRHDSSSG